MQIPSNEIIPLIGWVSAVFLIAPVFLIVYITVYNRRKKKHEEETVMLKQTFQHELLKTQMEVQEHTLKTIASDLHDNINQLLGLIVITLSAVDLRDEERAKEKIDAAEALALRSCKEIRSLSRLLHGEELIGKGLLHAISFELDWVEKSGAFYVDRTGIIGQPPQQPEKDLIIFRIFQESLHNIIRHARATTICIHQAYNGDTLTLSLEDDGCGFDPEQEMIRSSGMGLNNIRKRASMIGGAAQFISAAGKGSCVTITVPYSTPFK